jgi:hypothetical protein
MDAVEEGLSYLGDSPKEALFFHLENSFNLSRERIPENLEEFAKALEKIFGFGAQILELLILKRLYAKLGLIFDEKETRDFLEHINTVKGIYRKGS